MKNTENHLLFSFGLTEVFLFYLISFVFIYFIFFFKKSISNKKSVFMNLLLLIFCVFVSVNYLIIWFYGENSTIGGYFIDYGVKNKKYITWGSMFFLILITYIYSTERFKKR